MLLAAPGVQLDGQTVSPHDFCTLVAPWTAHLGYLRRMAAIRFKARTSIGARQKTPYLFGWALCAPVFLAGCGSEQPGQSQSALEPEGSTSAQSSQILPSSSEGHGTGASSPSTTTEVILSIPAASASGAPIGSECQRDTYEAKRAELNLLLLVDLSGSMLAQVNAETGETQWEAVREAIREFVNSPIADGLGISIT